MDVAAPVDGLLNQTPVFRISEVQGNSPSENRFLDEKSAEIKTDTNCEALSGFARFCRKVVTFLVTSSALRISASHAGDQRFDPTEETAAQDLATLDAAGIMIESKNGNAIPLGENLSDAPARGAQLDAEAADEIVDPNPGGALGSRREHP